MPSAKVIRRRVDPPKSQVWKTLKFQVLPPPFFLVTAEALGGVVRRKEGTEGGKAGDDDCCVNLAFRWETQINAG